MSNLAIAKAVEIAGGQSQLARQISKIMGKPILQQHVWKWLNTVPVLPAEYCLPIEKITDGAVTRHELRPDIYPVEAA
ncbi:hypothetical protein LCGC14_1942480 [marine sediment metagenome]|uniref:Helix-turn-helix domain-containing protein n=1 Tax=marine sediment metagenome TaxID=412755 RepID=A0A0F9G8F6_9ZZZZ